VDDLARIRAQALVPKAIPVYGFLYDVCSAKLMKVEGARAASAVCLIF
jgi:hypothetical protein